MADKYSASELRALGEKGHAFKKADGTYSYPIGDAEDLTSAIHAVGRGSASHEDIRKFIVKRAGELGLSDKIPDTWNSDGSMKDGEMRSEVIDQANMAVRSVLLDDISIRSGGDGRTVVAYAAIFDAPYEVQDMDGHYMETIQRSCFDKTLAERMAQVVCLYNHGKTLYGTPSERFSMPLGLPLEIRPDNKGLLTVTRYNKNPLADEILESIRSGEMRTQSFRAQFMPGRSQRTRGGYNGMDSIVRSEAKLFDFGPTPIAVNHEAAIVGVRSGMPVVEELVDTIHGLGDDDRRELIRILGSPLTLNTTARSDTEGDSNASGDNGGIVGQQTDAGAAPTGTPAANDTPANTGHLSGPTQEQRQRRVRAMQLATSTLTPERN